MQNELDPATPIEGARKAHAANRATRLVVAKGQDALALRSQQRCKAAQDAGFFEGEIVPVTHFLRVVRGALLKGQGPSDMWRELAALLAFACVVTALAMARYRRTLD